MAVVLDQRTLDLWVAFDGITACCYSLWNLGDLSTVGLGCRGLRQKSSRTFGIVQCSPDLPCIGIFNVRLHLVIFNLLHLSQTIHLLARVRVESLEWTSLRPLCRTFHSIATTTSSCPTTTIFTMIVHIHQHVLFYFAVL